MTLSFFVETPYECYHWSKKENERNLNGGWSIENERKTCESYTNFIYTQGDDSKAPGCGACYCCQPKPGKSEYINKS